MFETWNLVQFISINTRLQIIAISMVLLRLGAYLPTYVDGIGCVIESSVKPWNTAKQIEIRGTIAGYMYHHRVVP